MEQTKQEQKYITEVDEENKTFDVYESLSKYVLASNLSDDEYDEAYKDLDVDYDMTFEEIESAVKKEIENRIGREVEITYFPTLDFEGSFEPKGGKK